MSPRPAAYNNWASRRRSRAAFHLFLAVSLFLAAASFAAGYFRQSQQVRALRSSLHAQVASLTAGLKQTPATDQGSTHAKPDGMTTTVASEPAAVSPRREEALVAFDEALHAAYERRFGEAGRALARAEAVDPALPGVDIARGIIAFDSGNLPEVHAAARSALAKGQFLSDANMLLGLEAWAVRSGDQASLSTAAANASASFSAAAEAAFFSAPPWYFWGDVLRYSGREDEGLDRARGALHRLHPWDSATLVSAKLLLAADEAGLTPLPLPDRPGDGADPAGHGLNDLLEAWARGEDLASFSARWRATLTGHQASELLSDPWLADLGEILPGRAAEARGGKISTQGSVEGADAP
jgi:hypothetical protein